MTKPEHFGDVIGCWECISFRVYENGARVDDSTANRVEWYGRCTNHCFEMTRDDAFKNACKNWAWDEEE